jgi:hypothetical protein
MAKTPNNRVTTQQFYEAQLETNKTIAEMERRIMAELKGVPTQVDTNKEEIDRLRKRSNIWDGVNSLGILIAGLWAALKGS